MRNLERKLPTERSVATEVLEDAWPAPSQKNRAEQLISRVEFQGGAMVAIGTCTDDLCFKRTRVRGSCGFVQRVSGVLGGAVPTVVASWGQLRLVEARSLAFSTRRMNSDARMRIALQSRNSVSTVGDAFPRSSILTYVRWTSALKPSFSWLKPARSRALRNSVPSMRAKATHAYFTRRQRI